MASDHDDERGEDRGGGFEAVCPGCGARFSLADAVSKEYGHGSQSRGCLNVDINCPECHYYERVVNDIDRALA